MLMFSTHSLLSESSINEKRTPRKRRLSVSLKRHALGGTHFCAQSRDRNSFPLILLRLAGFRGAQALAKIGALRQRRLAASSTGRASPPLPWGQNLAQNRALGPRGLAHSLRQISLYVSRPYAHVIRAGLFSSPESLA